MTRIGATLLVAALGVSLDAGCATSVQHGRVLEGSAEDPFVTVEAGNVQLRSGRFFARYAVDRATHTCWLIVGTSLAPMECCAARRASALREVITWESDASCGPTPEPTAPVRPLGGASATGGAVDPAG